LSRENGGLFENTKGVPLPYSYTGLKDTPKVN